MIRRFDLEEEKLRDGSHERPVRLNIWKVVDRMGRVFYVRCPSRSGAKIFAADGLGGTPNFTTELVETPPPEVIVHTAEFETVQAFAARMEEEKKSRAR